MKKLALAALIALAATAASAQMPNVPQKAPPVKKFEGVCYPPESIFYARIKDNFFPFVAMIDCVKSGGTPAKR